MSKYIRGTHTVLQVSREMVGVRYKTEARNAELKNVIGYDRVVSYSIDYMRMQGAVTVFVANIRRILGLS